MQRAGGAPLGSSDAQGGHGVEVGLISDTHGLLRDEALHALRGCAHIVHAGDVGDPQILHALARLAPLSVVRGNNDRGPWAQALPVAARVELAGTVLHVLHDLGELPQWPAPSPCHVIVSGHSHRAATSVRDGVLHVNPGSAGPRRFRLPVTVARLSLDGEQRRVQILALA